uniref:AAA+ ATPase domain-containing protein n=1 Tax=Globisporangium ultimum (strain ATCC 200006 / CBS 805.95 / DAOM BR144) TaxID=431595 RepID=K3WDU6_GLOUD
MAPGKRRRTTMAEENGAKNGSAAANKKKAAATTASSSGAVAASQSDAKCNRKGDANAIASSADGPEAVKFETLCAEYDAIITLLEGKYSFIRALMSEFWETLRKNPKSEKGLIIENDAEWFWFAEMKYLIIFLYEMAFMEFSMSVTKPDLITVGANSTSQLKETLSNRDNMQERVEFLARLKNYVINLGNLRVKTTVDQGKTLPRVFRLAKIYKLSEQETDLFQLLVVLQGCQSNAVRCQMIEEDAQRKMTACQRLAGISEIDVVEFHDDQREHVKEGTVIVDEENYCTALSLSNICVRVLLGRTLSSNQVLKLSQTALEDLLKDEGMVFTDVLDHKAGESTSAKANSSNSRGKRRERDERSDESESSESHSSSSESEFDEKDSTAFSFIGGYGDRAKKSRRKYRAVSDADYSNNVSIPAIMDQGEMKPYNPSNQLDYLEDRFQVVAFAIRASGARVKDQMKEAGTKQPWDSSAPASAGRRELKAKQRVHDRRTLHRLNLTKKANMPLPRLEELAARFKLNKFEQNVIVMLIGKTISPVIKNLIDGVDTSPVQRMDESIIINQILSVFCDTFQEQVAHRVYFYKSSRLLSRGLVKLHRGRWHSTAGDLVDQRVELDRRVLDWVVGLDTEINELVEGSDLYYPKVQLDQVVLPEDHKATILQTVESYENFRKYRKKSGLEDTISYGAGLVLLLCGASGTGKTMTVNAVAHHLKKRVLLVDFPSLQGKRQEGVETDADLRGLFREAEMSNAVLFFDECETIFKQRDMGGDRLLNALLTEIERYEGIVFLATNRPFDLDEAMHRRITAVFEFKAPDHIQRRKIWKVLINNHLKTSDDIDWDAISLKYELSGGFIKNAILSALLKAISRNAEDPVINHDDIVTGCALQMRGSLHMKTFDHRVVPTSGLDSLIVEDSVKEKLLKIVQFEKARSVIYGQWGFDFGEAKSKQKGISVLLCGPSGVGKVAAAKSIGFEIGRPLKLVNFSQLQSDSVAETRRSLRAVFDDARLMDAVLVLEGFESFGSHLEMGATPLEGMDSPRFRVEVMRLLDMMDNFPSVTILIADVEKTQSSALLNSEVSRRLKFVVEMRNPNAKLREKLWRACFPEKAPMENTIDFKRLAERYELSHSSISDAVFRGAASAALREESKRLITMKDLMDAAEVEKKKARGGTAGAMDNLFV